IGWAQAVEFYQALRDTRRPFLFKWGQGGHGERSVMPKNLAEDPLPLDLRTDLSLPAFTNGSLDSDPGDGNPLIGDPAGTINGYLYWETATIVDDPEAWEMTVALVSRAPQPSCTVDITPRRVQNFKPNPGDCVAWSNTDLATDTVIQSGTV